MKRQHLLTFILSSFFIVVAFYGGSAYASISGDEVCGGSKVVISNGKIVSGACGVSDLKTIFQKIYGTIISLGLPLLIVFVIYRFVMAWYSLQQGNANAYKEATKKATEAIIGFLMIVLLFGGIFLTILKYLGVKSDGDFNPLRLLQLISASFIPHAYATTHQLPNPLGVDSLYDFILSVINVAMKFFVYPALIGIWVWSGFSYVLAQGAPEKLKKTHNLLMWAFITTLIVFMTQGFLIAIKGSVNKILPASTTSTTPGDVTGTPDGRVAPKEGEVGSSCTLPDGSYGQVVFGGACGAGRGAGRGTVTADCFTITTESVCEASKSSSGAACVWSGGRDATCSSD